MSATSAKLNTYLTAELTHKFFYVSMSFFRILFRLHKVMYKQLSSWLLHGTLMDPYTEFYIHKVKKMKALAPAVAENQDSELGIGGLSGDQLQQIQVHVVE